MKILKKIFIGLTLLLIGLFSCSFTLKSEPVRYAAAEEVTTTEKYTLKVLPRNEGGKSTSKNYFIIGEETSIDIEATYTKVIDGIETEVAFPGTVSLDIPDTKFLTVSVGTPVHGSNRYMWTITSKADAEKSSLTVKLKIDDAVVSECVPLLLEIREANKTLYDWVVGLLNSAVLTTLSITALVTIVWRAILKIYNLGKSDKKMLVTKNEQKEFENDMRRDMRGYAEQIQKTAIDSSMRVIEKELKNLDDVHDIATEMKVMKSSLEAEMKNMNEKYNEIKSVSDSVRTLNNKVMRLEYGTENSGERRSEN